MRGSFLFFFIFLFLLEIVYAQNLETKQTSHIGFWGSMGSSINKDLSGGFGFRLAMLAFNVGFIDDQQIPYSQIIDYPIESNYTYLGKYKVQPTWGFDIIYYPRILDKSFYSIGIETGIYFQEYAKIAQSNVSELLYNQGSEYKTLVGVGIAYEIYITMVEDEYAKWCFLLGIEAHSVRGINIKVGLGI